MATKMNLALKRGDTGQWDVSCLNKNGGPLDLTGAVLRFTVKRLPDDLDSAAVLRADSAGIGGIAITDAGGGLARLTIPASASTALTPTVLYQDLQVTEAGGIVTTLIEGRFTIEGDITQSY